MNPLKPFLRQGFALGALHAGGMALAFLVGVLLARQLGPEGYGTYAFAMAAAAIIGVCLELGLPMLVLREFAQEDGEVEWANAKGLLRWSTGLIGLAGLVAVGATYGVTQSTGPAIAVAVCVTILLGLTKLRVYALLSLGHVIASQASSLILRPAVLVALLLAAMALSFEINAQTALLAHVVAAGCAFIAVGLLLRHFAPTGLRRSKGERTPRAWLALSIPMGLTEGLRLLQGQMAILLTGALLGASAAGLYKVAEATALAALVPISIVNTIAAPHFARHHRAGREAELQRLARLASAVMAISVGLAAIVIFLIGEELLGFAFGDAFRDSARPLTILLAGWTVACLFGPVVTLCNMAGQERAVTAMSVLAVLGQLGMGLVLIPRYGISGAAIALVTGQLVLFCGLSWRARRHLGIAAGLVAPPVSVALAPEHRQTGSSPMFVRAAFRRLETIAARAASMGRRAWIGARYADISFGPGVTIARGARLATFDGGSIAIGAGSSIGANAEILAKGGAISIGDRALLNSNAMVVAVEKISIGNDVLIAENVTIRDHDHSRDDRSRPFAEQGHETSPVTIGDNVWLAASVTVTMGVRIGRDVVVGANAAVTRDLDDGGTYGGVPAKPLGSPRP